MPRMYPERRASAASWFRLTPFILVGCVLAWLIVTRSFVSYLAEVAPATALSLSPSEPTALLRVADAELAPIRQQQIEASARRGQPAGDTATALEKSAAAAPAEPSTPALAAVRERAAQALTSDPLSARALRILGEVADVSGDAAHATQLLELAARRRSHETPAVYLTMLRSYEAKDVVRTLHYADVLLRTQPDLTPHAAHVLVRMAENSGASHLLKERLAANPPWRARFLPHMLNSITDARTPLDILLSLKASPYPPTMNELRSYVGFLIERRFFELAYYTWLQFLPTDQLARIGFLYNGDFESPMTGLPFEWSIQHSSGANIEIYPTEEPGNNALKVEFVSDRVQLGDVSQRLALAPGSYRLNGKYKGEVLGRRGLRWRILCADGATTMLGETPMFLGQQRTWRDLELKFSVPDNNCRSQLIRLVHDSRHISEQFVTGTAWYDNLVIERL